MNLGIAEGPGPTLFLYSPGVPRWLERTRESGLSKVQRAHLRGEPPRCPRVIMCFTGAQVEDLRRFEGARKRSMRQEVLNVCNG